MDKEIKDTGYFLAALTYFKEKRGWGFQEALAAETGFTPGHISLLVNRLKNPSTDAMSKIAQACGHDLPSFLLLGKKIIEHPGSDVIDIARGENIVEIHSQKEGKEDMGEGDLSVRILNDRVNDQRDAINKMSAAINELHSQYNNLHAQYNGLKRDCEKVIDCLDEYRKTGNRECLERLGVEG